MKYYVFIVTKEEYSRLGSHFIFKEKYHNCYDTLEKAISFCEYMKDINHRNCTIRCSK